MTRELILQNVMVNYSKYGVTEEIINDLIDSGLKEGLNYDAIYLGIKLTLSNVHGEEFLCSSDEIAKAFDITQDEMSELIEQSRRELIKAGENPDDYFRTVKARRYIIQ